MRAIDGETLYERACDLEAQALAYVGKIVNDESKIEEWKIWSAILIERTAFKHDVFDAPTIEPDIVMCKDCKHRTSYWGNCKLLEEKYHSSVLVDGDDFCSRAERRTDAED